VLAETLRNLVGQTDMSILYGGDHSAIADFTLSDLVMLAARQDASAT